MNSLFVRASTNHNWCVWHWPWHNVTREEDRAGYYYSHFAGVGPFQWHWYSSEESW